jgi:hypothetical protein
MTIALPDRPSVRPSRLAAFVAKVGHVVLTLLVLALIVCLAVSARVFVFEYFHGDPRPWQTLVQLIPGHFHF